MPQGDVHKHQRPSLLAAGTGISTNSFEFPTPYCSAPNTKSHIRVDNGIIRNSDDEHGVFGGGGGQPPGLPSLEPHGCNLSSTQHFSLTPRSVRKQDAASIPAQCADAYRLQPTVQVFGSNITLDIQI